MNDTEWLKKQGQLFTEKQYRRSILVMILWGCLSLMVFSVGFFVLIFATTTTIRIIGGALLIIGFVLLIPYAVYCFDNGVKIQFYRHYKKHPEDFDNKG